MGIDRRTGVRSHIVACATATALAVLLCACGQENRYVAPPPPKVTVAVPVQRFRAVAGALMLSTQGADIDNMVTAERLAIFKVFLIAAGVMVVLSFLLAGTIAGPMRRLAHGAQAVGRRIRARVEIPDYTKRRDEIGHLSGSLREMTGALYARIEAIESFAADVGMKRVRSACT